VGTMEYLSPEYAQGFDSGSKRDIWAIGILVFEMLVGKNPFESLR
jgi:serine/threonine-protein kinase